jgi:hypothetical protein
VTLVVLPTAAEREADRLLEIAFAPELLDEVPLPIGLPMTFTFGLETEAACEPDVVFTVALDPEFEFEFWAKAGPHSIAIALAARRIDLIEALL